MIEMAFDDLIKSLRKGTTEESVKMIRRAFEFAREAHQGVRRKSGEPDKGDRIGYKISCSSAFA